MGRHGLWEIVRNEVQVDAKTATDKYKKIARESKNPDRVKFNVTYDFKRPKENEADVRKFYRNLDKLIGEKCVRRTRSEIVVHDLETAERIRTLAQKCGARVYLNASIEL